TGKCKGEESAITKCVAPKREEKKKGQLPDPTRRTNPGARTTQPRPPPPHSPHNPPPPTPNTPPHTHTTTQPPAGAASSHPQPPTPHSTQQRKAAMQEPAGGIISPEELATRWLKQPYPPTPQQSAVISAPPQGSYIVVAGAGAGKTETMAARVVWLVANGYV